MMSQFLDFVLLYNNIYSNINFFIYSNLFLYLFILIYSSIVRLMKSINLWTRVLIRKLIE